MFSELLRTCFLYIIAVRRNDTISSFYLISPQRTMNKDRGKIYLRAPESWRLANLTSYRLPHGTKNRKIWKRTKNKTAIAQKIHYFVLHVILPTPSAFPSPCISSHALGVSPSLRSSQFVSRSYFIQSVSCHVCKVQTYATAKWHSSAAFLASYCWNSATCLVWETL